MDQHTGIFEPISLVTSFAEYGCALQATAVKWREAAYRKVSNDIFFTHGKRSVSIPFWKQQFVMGPSVPA